MNKDERPSLIGAELSGLGVVKSGHGERLVGELPSFVALCPSASGKARDCTTRRGKACRTSAHRLCGGARFLGSEGAALCM